MILLSVYGTWSAYAVHIHWEIYYFLYIEKKQVNLKFWSFLLSQPSGVILLARKYTVKLQKAVMVLFLGISLIYSFIKSTSCLLQVKVIITEPELLYGILKTFNQNLHIYEWVIFSSSSVQQSLLNWKSEVL